MYQKIITLSICALGLSTTAEAKRVRALFLGNSYTAVNNLPEIVKQFAAASGDTLEYAANTPGGYTFQGHSSNANSLSLIAQGNWDFVILQEQSQLPAFPDGQVASQVFPYAARLDSLIQANNHCATTLFYVTWGRKNGDADNCPFFPPLCTYDGMDDRLQMNYTLMAEQNDAALAPVAMVWRKLRSDFPTMELYDGDGSHPSSRGSFAAAAAFYSILFEKDPSQNTYTFNLNNNEANQIKAVAKSVVFDSLSYWNRFLTKPNADFSYSTTGLNVEFTNNSVMADTYEWDFGDGTSSNDLNPSHLYNSGGNYRVKLSAKKANCIDVQEQEITVQSTSIDNTQKIKNLQLYPNPLTGDKLHIELSENVLFDYSISDVLGNMLIQGSSNQAQTSVDISRLPAGTYWIIIRTGNGLRMQECLVKY